MPMATDFTFSAGKLDADDLRVLRFSGSEGLSQYFDFELELGSFETDVDPESVVGEPGRLTIHTPHGDRVVDGIVSRWEEVGHGRKATYYNARLVPKVWTLALIRQSRIFQKMSTPDILKKVLNDSGIPANAFKLSLKGSYDPRTYCVQYRETDLDFIGRLMEEEGMFFFFEHTEDRGHVMIVGDSPDVHPEFPEDPIVRFREADSGMLGEEQVKHFRYARVLRSGAVALKEFDFKKPSLALKAALKGSSDKEAAFEYYDYPGEYHAQGLGDRLAKIRREEERAESYLGIGEADCRRFVSGYRFTMEEHPNEALNQEYLVVRVHHEGEQPHAGVGGDTGGADKPIVYRAMFDCIPYKTPFRPARITPRPRIDGPQTAVVTGPPGEEIHCDEHGRVKVKFHWDRADTKGDKTSCWIRVSQAWGGAGYGAVIIPRIGQEVIVEFLEGDPDRPLITGRVYNGASPLPYELPADKTMTALKSNSSPGGDGANELRFEDKKGKEQFLIQAEKDLEVYVKNDAREWIGRDDHTTVARDRLAKIERDDHLLVDRDDLADVTRDQSLKVGGKQMIEISGTRTLKVGGDVHESSGGGFSQEVTKNLYVKAQALVIEGGQQITLKVGGSFLVVDSSGVTVVGSTVKINSGGAAGSGTAVQAVPTVKPMKAMVAANAASSSGVKGESGGSSGAGKSGDDRPTHKDPPKNAPPQKDKTWIEIELLDANKKPVAGEPYEVELPNKKVATGTTGADGVARIEGVDPGTCKIRFPRLDKDSWKKA